MGIRPSAVETFLMSGRAQTKGLVRDLAGDFHTPFIRGPPGRHAKAAGQQYGRHQQQHG